jgi:ABC-type proline/glycine betaine transport system permease subunit
VAEGGGDVIDALPLASALSDFKDAIDFIFHERESVSGGIQVGGSELWGFTGRHLGVSGLAVLIASAIAMPIGLWLGHIGKGEFLAISVSNVGRAVPTLALLAFFIAYLGVGFTNVVVVLVLLAIPPILTNTYVGTRQVDPETVDAARGVGMTEPQIVRRIRLPMALSTIFGGIRTSSVNVVATATIAPLASVDTLGTPIINGNVYGDSGRLGAAILVALLTLAIDVALAGVQRAVTPAGLKRREAERRRRRPFVPQIRRGEQPT